MAVVSVIIPLYNKADYVARAIDSILAQTFQDFQIIVIDDGSTDNGPEIVASYNDDRIRLLKQANSGPGAARNKGVKESSSQLITFLDADDEYLPEFLQKSIENLNNNPDCVLTVANHYRGIEKTVATTISPFNFGISTGPWRLPPESEANVLWGSLIFLQSWVIVCRRDIFFEYGGFYEHRCTYGEDQYLWLQLLLNFKIYRDTTPLLWYHTEDSELEMWARSSATPILPFLSDPVPIRKTCPPEYRPALERMFPYAAALNFSYMIYDEPMVEFWREYLKGIPEVHDMPLDHPRSKEQSGRDSKLYFEIDETLSDQVRVFCSLYSVSPEIFFLSCLAFLIWKQSGQETIVIGTPYSSKEQEEIQGLFGCFIHIIPVRLEIDSDMKAISFLDYVKNQYASAWQHTSIDIEELIDLSSIPKTTNINPVYQIAYSFNNRENRRDEDLFKNDLDLCMKENERFEGSLEYSTDLFDKDSMEMFAENFTNTARVLSVENKGSLGRLELMDDQVQKLVKHNNRTEVPGYLNLTFMNLFKESLDACNDKAAVKSSYDGTILTYRELDALSDSIARKLVAAGLKNGGFVGLYLNRDKWLLPSIIGVFKAGGAYVPLDPQYPRDRLADIISDADIQNILTILPFENGAQLLGSDMHIICADSGASFDQAVLPTVHPDQTAYILFTSGSTGKPKGVQIQHGSLVNLLLSMKSIPGMSSTDKMLALTTTSFDISCVELYLPLICGASLVMVDNDTSLDPTRLAVLIEDEKISFLQSTPSRMSLLLESGWKAHPGMKLLVGGEAVTRNLAARMLETGAEVWNGYGPTETTIYSSIHNVLDADRDAPIGKPIANTRLYILDKNNHILPPGIPGELAIGGAGLSPGYLGRPDLTDERFIMLPETEGFGVERIYRTGDLVQVSSNGVYRYLGRTDFQVKIRGFRIELGEIENTIIKYTNILETICSVWTRAENDKRIVAYYRADSDIDESSLREHIKKSLPDYMIPNHFISLSDFPRTSSGKTDRKSLPLPKVSGESITSKASATTIEEQILNIWCEVLGLDNIGIGDNFFDLGGHSILAVELIRKLNARIGGRWKLLDLFESPTVKGLSNIYGSDGISRMPLLFPVNRHGKHTPLFFVAGIYANRYFEDESHSMYEHDFLRYFNNIILILGSNRPLYGLRPRGIYLGERFHTSVEMMAKEYITEIKIIQPKGPYLIGGECFGGFIAHAIACQLRESGDEVSKLILLDTYRMKIGIEMVMRSVDFLRDIRNIFRDTVKALLHPYLNRKELYNIAESLLICFFPVTKAYRTRRYYEYGPRKYTSLLFRYRPRRYEGKTLLIVNEVWNKKHPSLCWDLNICPNLDARVIPGDHTTRLQFKTELLKKYLNEWLEINDSE